MRFGLFLFSSFEDLESEIPIWTSYLIEASKEQLRVEIESRNELVLTPYLGQNSRKFNLCNGQKSTSFPSTFMGLSFSSLFNTFSSLLRWSKDRDVRILMLGLDSAGKVNAIAPALFVNERCRQTTILYRLQVCLLYLKRIAAPDTCRLGKWFQQYQVSRSLLGR